MYTEIALVLVALILFISTYFIDTDRYVSLQHRVLDNYKNKREAALLIDNVVSRVKHFLDVIDKKYSTTRNEHVREIVHHMVTKFNPNTIVENNPVNNRNETSYTVNKGEKMYLCVRSRANPATLVDINTMMFVTLHELSHIGSYFTWGHGASFWQVFKFVLIEAIEAGVYKPVDYSKYPIVYCGMNIKHNPYYDDKMIDVSRLIPAELMVKN